MEFLKRELGFSENLPFIGNGVYLADHKKRFLSSSVGYWLRLQIKLTLSHFVLMAKFQNLERMDSVSIYSLIK